jgi:hypothetical protein
LQVLEAASRGYLQRLHDPKRGESQKAKREEYVERKLAAVIVQGHMRKRLAADEWQTRRSAAAHMQACYRGRRDRETVATHQEGRNELKAASEAAAAAERAAKEAERAAKEAAAQARCSIVSDLDAENAAEHAMVAKAAATAAATHLTEVEAKLAAASSGGDGGGGGAGLKLVPASIERVPRLFFKPLRTLGAMGSAGEFSLLSSYSRCGSLLVAAAPHTLIIEINGARYRSNALSAARSMVERRVMVFASVPAFRALASALAPSRSRLSREDDASGAWRDDRAARPERAARRRRRRGPAHSSGSCASVGAAAGDRFPRDRHSPEPARRCRRRRRRRRRRWRRWPKFAHSGRRRCAAWHPYHASSHRPQARHLPPRHWGH